MDKAKDTEVDILSQLLEAESPQVDESHSSEDDSPPKESETDSNPPQEGENTLDESGKTEEIEPLHKHPRFKEVVEEKNTYKQKLEEIETELVKLREAKTEPAPTNSSDERYETFKKLFGDVGQEYYNDFLRLSGTSDVSQTVAQEVDRILKEREKQQVEQEKLVSAYKEKYEIEIDRLSDEYGFSKNSFRAWFAKDPIIKPIKFDNGTAVEWDYDFDKGAKLYAIENKSTTRPAPTSGNTPPSSTSPEFKTLEDVANSRI